jgi:hypothetical protein
LRGLLKAGLNNAAALTLPPGYRPPVTRTLIAHAAGGVAYLNVDPAGTVTPVNLTGTAVTTYIFLDSVEFDTETVTQMLAGVRGESGAIFTSIPVVTSLPKLPEDGEEVDYLFQQTVVPADATWRTWRLRYVELIAAWLPVGAQEPIYIEDDTNRSQAFGVGWSQFTQLLTAQMPLKGLYRFEFGANYYYNPGNGNAYVGLNDGVAWPSSGTTQPSSGLYAAAYAKSDLYAAAHAQRKKAAQIAAGTIISWGTFVSVAATIQAAGRYLKAFPTRIDP